MAEFNVPEATYYVVKREQFWDEVDGPSAHEASKGMSVQYSPMDVCGRNVDISSIAQSIVSFGWQKAISV